MKRLVILGGLACLGSTAAQADVCGDLWYRRNAIYKAAGYCFHTRDGIAAFGNAGCLYDNVEDVPLSERQRREVRAIQADERAYGCR